MDLPTTYDETNKEDGFNHDSSSENSRMNDLDDENEYFSCVEANDSDTFDKSISRVQSPNFDLCDTPTAITIPTQTPTIDKDPRITNQTLAVIPTLPPLLSPCSRDMNLCAPGSHSHCSSIDAIDDVSHLSIPAEVDTSIQSSLEYESLNNSTCVGSKGGVFPRSYFPSLEGFSEGGSSPTKSSNSIHSSLGEESSSAFTLDPDDSSYHSTSRHSTDSMSHTSVTSIHNGLQQHSNNGHQQYTRNPTLIPTPHSNPNSNLKSTPNANPNTNLTSTPHANPNTNCIPTLITNPTTTRSNTNTNNHNPTISPTTFQTRKFIQNLTKVLSVKRQSYRGLTVPCPVPTCQSRISDLETHMRKVHLRGLSPKVAYRYGFFICGCGRTLRNLLVHESRYGCTAIHHSPTLRIHYDAPEATTSTGEFAPPAHHTPTTIAFLQLLRILQFPNSRSPEILSAFSLLGKLPQPKLVLNAKERSAALQIFRLLFTTYRTSPSDLSMLRILAFPKICFHMWCRRNNCASDWIQRYPERIDPNKLAFLYTTSLPPPQRSHPKRVSHPSPTLRRQIRAYMREDNSKAAVGLLRNLFQWQLLA